ncbi:MAG: hypothetical protein ACI4V7_03080 [Succinivibrionaceae bacterium]
MFEFILIITIVIVILFLSILDIYDILKSINSRLDLIDNIVFKSQSKFDRSLEDKINK